MGELDRGLSNNKKFFYSIAGLILSSNVQSACDLTGKDVFTCLDSGSFGCSGTYGKKQSIVGDNQKQLTVFMPKGSYTNSGYKKGLGTQGGAQFIKEIPGSESIEILFTATFHNNFQSNKGGKFGLGICSGNCPTGGKDSSMGSSIRLMWRGSNKGEIYLYYPDKHSRFGESVGRGSFFISPGIPQRYKIYTEMNTPGISNGIIKLFIDGELILSHDNYLFRTDNQQNHMFNKIISSTFFGGGKPNWASELDTEVTYSDVCINIK